MREKKFGLIWRSDKKNKHISLAKYQYSVAATRCPTKTLFESLTARNSNIVAQVNFHVREPEGVPVPTNADCCNVETS